MRTNALKTLLTARTPAINAWVSLDSEHVCEVLSHAGFDSVTVDLQHGMFGLDQAINMLRAVSAGPATPLARPSQNDRAEIGKLLDAGAYGIICPNIDTAEQAEYFVASCRYPTRGSRSFGPARGLLYGGADYILHADNEVLTWAMIESRAALENLDDILATPSLNGLYIGPNDLAMSLGMAPGGEINDEILQTITTVITRAHEMDRFVGIFVSDGDEARKLIELGADLVTPGNDVGLLRAAATTRINLARDLA